MYAHEFLSSPRSIRLLSFHTPSSSLWPLRKSSNSHTISITLTEISLDNPAISYEALSYTWGNPNAAAQTITCNGQSLSVSPNCLAALLQLRRRSTRKATQNYWIDAICINQGSVEEKNLQVPLMDEIYSKAARVLVWLGEGTKESGFAFGYMGEVSREALKWYSRHPEEMGTPLRGELLDKIKGLQVRFNGENQKRYGRVSDTEETNMLSDIFLRPWFRRMWTFQEIVLCKSVLLLCGDAELSWDNIVLSIGCLSALDSQPGKIRRNEVHSYQTLQKYIEARKLIHAHLRNARNETSIKFGSELNRVRDLRCSNPLDKMYGLVGYLKAVGYKDLPEVDYRKPTWEVYRDFTRHAILQDQTLELLYELGINASMTGLPSWVPNWTTAGPPVTRISYRNFAASKSSLYTFHFAQLSETQLHTTGIIIDTIQSRAESHMPDEFSHRTDGELTRALATSRIVGRSHCYREWARIANEVAASYPTGTKDDTNAISLLCHTILQDGHMSNIPSDRLPKHVLDQFPEWLAFTLANDLRGPQGAMAQKCVDENVAYAMTRPAVQKLYFATPADRAHWTALPEWRTLTAVNYSDAREIQQWIYRSSIGMTLFRTRRGYLGIASDIVEVGDEVMLVAGLQTPLVVRRKDREKIMEAVAPAYIHGVMKGEMWPDDASKLQDFVFC